MSIVENCDVWTEGLKREKAIRQTASEMRDMFKKGYVDDTNRKPPYIEWRYYDDSEVYGGYSSTLPPKTINAVKNVPPSVLEVVEEWDLETINGET